MTHLAQKSMALTKTDDTVCKPLDTLDEILHYAQNPPSWRTLCKDLQPHSKMKIRNIEVNQHFGSITLDCPQTFCHFDPEAEDVQRHDENSLPKTLVCHDMANGYHDDSYIDGTGQHDAYTFYNWAGIDIFCYFSHHLLTIPPLGWINVGHAQGVKVIGTLITEWLEGVQFWDQVLSSETSYQNLASALVTIAKTLKLDGWLLNVENKISKPAELLEFVRYLHRMLHQELADPVLIWYDSVTIDGHLNWQNKLNEKNKDFFDACDGFFTNYSWTEKDVELSATNAGDRLADLYVGIDVWGRNFYGGGQFNVQEAVSLAHSYGCSLAIFAPAWTHEALADSHGDVNAVLLSDELSSLDRFLLRDRALWGSIWPYLHTRVPCALPFRTSFCKGQGVKRWLYGEVIGPVPWYNLRHMQYQPNSAHGPHGYLLSTRENVVHVSKHGIVRDGEGVVRYEEAFRLSRLELHSVKLKEDDAVDESAAAALGRRENEVDGGKQYDMKRKMKNAFRHMFKIKKEKMEDGLVEDGTAATDVDAGAAPGVERGGASMVQVSVSVDLGRSKKKTRYALAHVPDEAECLEQFARDGFIGGSCLKINPADRLSPDHRTTRLFHCDFSCEEALIVCVVTKTLPEFKDQFLDVILHCVDAEGRPLRAVLAGREPPEPGPGPEPGSLAVLPAAGNEFRELQKYLLLNQPDCYISIENSYGWNVRYYPVPMRGGRVRSINVRAGRGGGPVLLGYLGLCAQSPEPSLLNSEASSQPMMLTKATQSRRSKISKSGSRSEEPRKKSPSTD